MASDEGRVIAAGRDTEIVDLGGGRVLRRPRRPRDMTAEGAVMRAVLATGYPAPRVHEVRPDGLVLDRIDGTSMLDDLGRRPWRMRAHARLLAQLLSRLSEVMPPPGLPQPLGPGNALLHLDFHPGNVLLSTDGPVVIDWTNAARGPAAADVADSWLLLAAAEPPAGGRTEQAVVAAGRRLFLRSFLAASDRAGARRHLDVVYRYRRGDRNMGQSELTRMAAVAQRWGSAPTAAPHGAAGESSKRRP